MQTALFVKIDYDISILLPYILCNVQEITMIACHHQEGHLIEKMDILVVLVMVIIYNNKYTKLFLILQLYFLSLKSGSVNLSSSSIIVFKKEFNIKIKPKGQPIIRPVILLKTNYYYYNIIVVLLNCLLHP
jgi:hypothetical protein